MTAVGAVNRIRTSPWWVKVLVVYGLSRVLTTTFMLIIQAVIDSNEVVTRLDRAGSGIFLLMSSWDSEYFRAIVNGGYPTVLPLTWDGFVDQNVWAFLPGYPLLVKSLIGVTGLGFSTVGVAASVVFGAGAALALYRMLAGRVGERSALWAVVLFCFGPMSFTLQLVYTESMFLFLLFCSLVAMVERRYLLILPFALAAAFTRPGILSVALALAIVFLIRFFGREAFPNVEKVKIIVVGLAVAAAGLSWPLIATAVTGIPEAYLQTEMSWWHGWVGRPEFIPLTPWFLMAGKALGIPGLILVIVVVLLVTWWLTRKRMRALGPEILSYGASYSLYLFAVFLPQQSTLRLILPLTPLLGDPAIVRVPALRWVLLVASIVGQAFAIYFLWFISYP